MLEVAVGAAALALPNRVVTEAENSNCDAKLGPALAGLRLQSSSVAGLDNRRVPLAAALSRQGTIAFHAAKMDILFGTVWGAGIGSGSPGPESAGYLRTVERQCSLVLDWGLNGRVLRDGFDFRFGDQQMMVANENDLANCGGYLVVAGSPPPWITSSTSKATALAEMHRIITTPITRYAGKVDHWIVVNEGISVTGENTRGLAKSAWLSSIGDNYIERAFTVARKADPSATLLYNEYGIEEETRTSEPKRAAVIELLTTLKRAGLVDGLGIQGHLDIKTNFDPGSFKSFLDAVYSLGLDIFITELDVNDREAPANLATRDSLVAERYAVFLRTVLIHPGLRSVNAWGLSDDHSWLQTFSPRPDGLPSRPCLFDSHLSPKASYDSVTAAFEYAATKRIGLQKTSKTSRLASI